jgi:hypothetical protein
MLSRQVVEQKKLKKASRKRRTVNPLLKESPGTLFLDLLAHPSPKLFDQTFVNHIANKGCFFFWR